MLTTLERLWPEPIPTVVVSNGVIRFGLTVYHGWGQQDRYDAHAHRLSLDWNRTLMQITLTDLVGRDGWGGESRQSCHQLAGPSEGYIRAPEPLGVSTVAVHMLTHEIFGQHPNGCRLSTGLSWMLLLQHLMAHLSMNVPFYDLPRLAGWRPDDDQRRLLREAAERLCALGCHSWRLNPLFLNLSGRQSMLACHRDSIWDRRAEMYTIGGDHALARAWQHVPPENMGHSFVVVASDGREVITRDHRVGLDRAQRMERLVQVQFEAAMTDRQYRMLMENRWVRPVADEESAAAETKTKSQSALSSAEALFKRSFPGFHEITKRGLPIDIHSREVLGLDYRMVATWPGIELHYHGIRIGWMCVDTVRLACDPTEYLDYDRLLQFVLLAKSRERDLWRYSYVHSPDVFEWFRDLKSDTAENMANAAMDRVRQAASLMGRMGGRPYVGLFFGMAVVDGECQESSIARKILESVANQLAVKTQQIAARGDRLEVLAREINEVDLRALAGAAAARVPTTMEPVIQVVPYAGGEVAEVPATIYRDFGIDWSETAVVELSATEVESITEWYPNGGD